MKKTKKVLFILKKRQIYSGTCYSTTSSGLFNSANFVNDMLLKNKIDTKIVEVLDNNEIDKHVSQHKPDIVIIEALWVVPSKFEILQKLHPKVKWIIRLHSELPFIANEGIAIKWLKEYTKYANVIISSNSKYFIESMKPLIGKIDYLPNYYPITKPVSNGCKVKNNKVINVGLFGAIRPLKNTLTQAVAAMSYANEKNKILHLHVNASRIEQDGDNNLKNIRALFIDTPHSLVEHGWLSHRAFTELVSKMDVGLQVSLSETYNIVAADFVNQEVPIITSKEIVFVNSRSQVDITKDASEIKEKIKNTLSISRILTVINKYFLLKNSRASEIVWTKYLKK